MAICGLRIQDNFFECNALLVLDTTGAAAADECSKVVFKRLSGPGRRHKKATGIDVEGIGLK